MKVNCRSAVDALLKNRGWEKDIAILHEMANHLDRGGKSPLDWADSRKGHFSEMINGKRAFPVEWVIAFEKATRTAFADMLQPSGPPIKMEKLDFQPRGLRYVAYKDTIELYEKLMTEVDKYDDAVVFNQDEYFKSLLDYVLENDAKNGFRFLIENNFPGERRSMIYFDIQWGRWEGRFLRFEHLNEGLWKMLMEQDDVELFKRATRYDTWKRFLKWDEDKEETYLVPLLSTEKIKDFILTSFIEQETSGEKKLNVFLPLVICYAVRKKDVALIQTALEQYEDMIHEQINSIFPQPTEEEIRFANIVNRSEIVLQGGIVIFADFDMLIGDIEGNGKWGEFKQRLKALSGGAILEKMRRKDAKDIKIGERFPDQLRGYESVRVEPDQPTTEIKMLQDMEKCGFRGVPNIYPHSEVKGVFEIELPRGHWNDYCRQSNEKLALAIRILSGIHKISAQTLEKGQAYLHGPFHPSEIGEDKIWNWKNCHIGDAFEDLAEALISLTDLCSTERGRHDAKATMKAISDAFLEYEIAENVKDLGDRFCAWLDKRLQECEEQGNYDEHRRLSLARSFAAMHRKALNELHTRSVNTDS